MSEVYAPYCFSSGPVVIQQPPEIYVSQCMTCGALVLDQQKHNEWHEQLRNSESEFWREVARKAINHG